MLKTITKNPAPQATESKIGPSDLTVKMLLHYSKAVTTVKIKEKKVLFNLN